MKRIKELMINISKRIKKSNIAQILKSRTIIKELENRIGELGKEKQELIDELRVTTTERDRFEKENQRIPSLELIVESADKSLKDKVQLIEEIEEKRCDLENKLFETNLELGKVRIELEQCQEQIKDYKTEGRYLVKKVRAGRTPNTNKTRISKPMSSRVTKYMRGEHE